MRAPPSRHRDVGVGVARIPLGLVLVCRVVRRRALRAGLRFFPSDRRGAVHADESIAENPNSRGMWPVDAATRLRKWDNPRLVAAVQRIQSLELEIGNLEVHNKNGCSRAEGALGGSQSGKSNS